MRDPQQDRAEDARFLFYLYLVLEVSNETDDGFIRTLDNILDLAFEHFKTVIEEDSSPAQLVAHLYSGASQMICEATGVSKLNQLPRGGPYERQILEIQVAWIPAVGIAKLFGREKLKVYPSVDDIKKAVDDKSVPYNDIQVMTWDLMRACQYGSVLEVLRYVHEEKRAQYP
jgi:hypothetical protein